MGGPAPIPVFICYSRRDKRWLERLRIHLEPLARDNVIDPWVDDRIRPGERWNQEIQYALEKAHVAVLLVSPHFFASDYIARHELPRILSAARQGGLLVLPVLLTPSIYRQTDLSAIQPVNDPSRTLVQMEEWEIDKVLAGLAEEILEVAQKAPAGGTAVHRALNERIEEAAGRQARDLDLSRLGASHLPAGVASLSRLRTLYLSRNQLSSLPPEIEQLSGLKTLYLSRIRILNLSRNHLETIPSEIGGLSNLQALDLSGNRISWLPSEISRLRALRTLDLRGNPLPIPPAVLEDVDDPLRILAALHR